MNPLTAEKYLKAYLQENNSPVPKTHQLADLLKLCNDINGNFELLLVDINLIEPFSVNIRYPGIRANKEDAKMVYIAVQKIRQYIRQQLGIFE